MRQHVSTIGRLAKGAGVYVADIEKKMAEFAAMREALEGIVVACRENDDEDACDLDAQAPVVADYACKEAGNAKAPFVAEELAVGHPCMVVQGASQPPRTRCSIAQASSTFFPVTGQ